MDPFKPYQAKAKILTAKSLSNEGAEAVALQAVAYVVGDEELRERFMAASGSDLEDLKRRITQRNFLVGVLDFLLADESAVVSFAEHGQFAPETTMLARARLASAT